MCRSRTRCRLSKTPRGKGEGCEDRFLLRTQRAPPVSDQRRERTIGTMGRKRDKHGVSPQPKAPARSLREAQEPVGEDQGDEGTWLSGRDDDAQRREAARLSRNAVKPGRPRE
jgi:hypothetical protein